MATPMLSCSRRYLSAVNAQLTAPTYSALAKPAPPSGEFLHQPLDVIGRAISWPMPIHSRRTAPPPAQIGMAPASNSPGLATIGGDHREEVDVGREDRRHS